MMSKPKVSIWADGACIPNPGVGGWGVLLICGTTRKTLSGVIPNATNNIAELTAAIEGLKALKTACAVTLYSDSQYLIGGASRNWRIKTNLELWVAYHELAVQHEIQYQWVRGHVGIQENELVDRLSANAIKTFERKTFNPTEYQP